MQVYVVASYCVFEGKIYNFNLWSYHNNGTHCMSFFSLMNVLYGRIASWDIRVLVFVVPNPVPCHWNAALLPC